MWTKMLPVLKCIIKQYVSDWLPGVNGVVERIARVD